VLNSLPTSNLIGIGISPGFYRFDVAERATESSMHASLDRLKAGRDTAERMETLLAGDGSDDRMVGWIEAACGGRWRRCGGC